MTVPTVILIPNMAAHALESPENQRRKMAIKHVKRVYRKWHAEPCLNNSFKNNG